MVWKSAWKTLEITFSHCNLSDNQCTASIFRQCATSSFTPVTFLLSNNPCCAAIFSDATCINAACTVSSSWISCCMENRLTGKKSDAAVAPLYTNKKRPPSHQKSSNNNNKANLLSSWMACMWKYLMAISSFSILPPSAPTLIGNWLIYQTCNYTSALSFQKEVLEALPFSYSNSHQTPFITQSVILTALNSTNW